MSAITVGKKEFRDAVRSRKLALLTAVFALFTLGGAYLASWAGDLFAEVDGEGAQSTTELVLALQSPAGFLVPIIALVFSYAAIARERERGSVKFLLGQPHSRREVVAGKILGRSAVVAVSILVGFGVGFVGLVVFVGSVSIVDYLLFTLVTMLFGAVYVCIGVGISAMTRSTTTAAVGVVGLIVLFWIVWGSLAQGLLFWREGSMMVDPMPEWFVSFVSIPPDSAYSSALSVVLGEGGFAMADVYQTERVPLLAEPWFGFVLLALWALVPVAIGLWRFDRADLS
ncbi:ABC transporter permease [Natronorubrum daqingense]|uniref:ABC transporter n=1 Tax=Natronorubrum daqingense TaxID=588898 RepID=A0A1N7F9D6_9EURY|nr:ABC transporter permease [Natronorubrum daqingense]APX97624.1 ABC transporter [Natronorubrum daqingense]SIR96886.1 ABC-2 type transport system permease protein [Natronorubrum daqingense]